MIIDLKALAEKLTTQEKANQARTVRLNTEDPQRDKFWRTLGRKIRNDVRHTR